MLSLLVTLFTLKNSLISSGFMQAEFISLGPTSLMIFPSLLRPLHFEILLELQIQIRPLIHSLHSTPTPAVLLCIFPFSVSFPSLLPPLLFPSFLSLKHWSHSLTSLSFILKRISVTKFYGFYPLTVFVPLPTPLLFSFFLPSYHFKPVLFQ